METNSPFARTMGFGSERDSEGRLVLTMAFETNKMGRPGFLHGGAIAGMLEAVAFATLAEALDADDNARIKRPSTSRSSASWASSACSASRPPRRTAAPGWTPSPR